MQSSLLASERVTLQKVVRTPSRALSQGIEWNLKFSKGNGKTGKLYVITEK